MSKYVRQFNVKLSGELADELVHVSEYYGLKTSELIRRWIFDGLAEMKRDKRYQQWRERGPTAREEEA